MVYIYGIYMVYIYIYIYIYIYSSKFIDSNCNILYLNQQKYQNTADCILRKKKEKGRKNAASPHILKNMPKKLKIYFA